MYRLLLEFLGQYDPHFHWYTIQTMPRLHSAQEHVSVQTIQLTNVLDMEDSQTLKWFLPTQSPIWLSKGTGPISSIDWPAMTSEQHRDCSWEFKKAKVITLVFITELGWLGYIDKHPVIFPELVHGAKVASGCPYFHASHLAEAFLMIIHECYHLFTSLYVHRVTQRVPWFAVV